MTVFHQLIFSQTTIAVAQSSSVSTNTVLRYTLLSTVIILMIIIVALSYILNDLAMVYFQNWKKDNGKSSTKNVATIALMMLGLTLTANAQAIEPGKGLTFGIDFANMPVDIYMLAFGVLVEMIIVYGLVASIFKLLKQAEAVLDILEVVKKPEKTFFETINDTVALEEEYKLDLSHDYDGIRELDNNIPGWWRMAFYATILFAPIYLFRMYGLHTIQSQYVELENENKAAVIKKTEYLKLAANNVDENSVKLSDANGKSAGKSLYMKNCVACHGIEGQGSVGPNLTDKYWIHKGGLKDIYYTIKYGWAEKGMKSWKDDFSPSQIADIASFVTTFQGTTPANPKVKEGEIYSETAIN
jgi:cytochrome c oxidase cbb3-type subunit 3